MHSPMPMAIPASSGDNNQFVVLLFKDLAASTCCCGLHSQVVPELNIKDQGFLHWTLSPQDVVVELQVTPTPNSNRAILYVYPDI